MICPDCSAIFDDRMETCPECGAVVAHKPDEVTPPNSLWDNDDPNVTGPHLVPGSQAGGQAEPGTQIVAMDPEKERGTRIVEVPLPPMVKQRARQRVKHKGMEQGLSRAQKKRALELEESGVSRTIDDMLKDLRLFYARLHRFDRWSLWILCAAFVSSFLPWCRVLSYGLTAGIQDYGLATAPLAGLSIVLIYLRTARRRLTLPLLLLQLLVVSGMGGVVVWRYISAVDIDFTYGIYLTALFAGLGALTSLLRIARVNV